jgi:hypothetical protein
MIIKAHPLPGKRQAKLLEISRSNVYCRRRRLRPGVIVERLWCSIKYEEVYLHAHRSVSAAKAGVGRYLEFYNGRRPHTALGKRTSDAACFTRPP